MNKQNTETLIEKYKYMFSERDRSIEVLKQQNKLSKDYMTAVANEDEIRIAQIKEEQKELGGFYAIAFGFECDDGWYNLLDELMGKIQEVDKDKITVINQIKEKFGGLRFNTGGTTEEAYDIIEEYEDKSFYVFEVCGKEGELCIANKWCKTVCVEHRDLETWTGIKQHYVPVKE